MAVKATRPKQQGPTIEEDLSELVSLLGETIRGLKRVGPPPDALRDAARRGSLGKRHMPALLAVTLAGPISVSDLARRLGLSLSATSTIVGQLSRVGLIERAEDESDRRRTIVRLHEDYRAALTAWTRQAMVPLRNTLELLSPQVRAHFMDGWRVLHEQASANDLAEQDCDDA